MISEHVLDILDRMNKAVCEESSITEAEDMNTVVRHLKNQLGHLNEAQKAALDAFDEMDEVHSSAYTRLNDMYVNTKAIIEEVSDIISDIESQENLEDEY